MCPYQSKSSRLQVSARVVLERRLDVEVDEPHDGYGHPAADHLIDVALRAARSHWDPHVEDPTAELDVSVLHQVGEHVHEHGRVHLVLVCQLGLLERELLVLTAPLVVRQVAEHPVGELDAVPWIHDIDDQDTPVRDLA